MSKLLIRPPKEGVNIVTRNDAIEECAQVLETRYSECNTLNLLHGAAALRTLKDTEEKRKRNATIEECARVADAILDEIRFTKENDAETTAKSIAIAIRALKDK